MNNNKKSLFNKLCEVQKLYFSKYSTNVEIHVEEYHIVMFTEQTMFYENFLKELVGLFENSNKRLTLGISNKNQFYIKIS